MHIWLLSVQNDANTSAKKNCAKFRIIYFKNAKFEADFEFMFSRSYILSRTVN